jgi:aryl-alcohol dehydrogenase-like predicted oxidoreductase
VKQRPLGQTGLQVTPIGLGLAALGRPGYINLGHAEDLGQEYELGAMEAHSHAVLDAAWALGIRYFDAARSYGRAEAFLASWLAARGVAVDKVVVGSKWGYTYTADWQVEAEEHEVKEHSLPILQRQTAESRRLLGSYLKLYQIHSATLESGVLNNRHVLAELVRLRRETGLQLGISLSGPQQAQTLRRALAVRLEDGSPLFGAVQATWNLLEPSAGPALAEAAAAGLGVIVKEAVANGRLTPRNPEPKLAPLREAAAELGSSEDALAMATVLAQPWTSVVLSGAATVEHLESNVQALELPLTPEVVERLRSLAEPPEEYWQTRSELPWN